MSVQYQSMFPKFVQVQLSSHLESNQLQLVQTRSDLGPLIGQVRGHLEVIKEKLKLVLRYLNQQLFRSQLGLIDIRARKLLMILSLMTIPILCKSKKLSG